MKHLYLVTIAVLTALMMSGCCSWCEDRCTDDSASDESGGNKTEEAAVADDPLASLYKGKKNSKTWVIDDPGSPDPYHMIFGGAFKITKIDGEYKLIPLSALKAAWGITDPEFVVDLDPLEGPNSGFCGLVDLSTHPSNSPKKHYLIITPDGENGIHIVYEVFEEGVENQCTRRQSHGGSAHGEN